MAAKPQAPPGRPVKTAASTSVQTASEPKAAVAPAEEKSVDKKQEIGGPKGLEPTRYGDWEKGGRCIDF